MNTSNFLLTELAVSLLTISSGAFGQSGPPPLPPIPIGTAAFYPLESPVWVDWSDGYAARNFTNLNVAPGWDYEQTALSIDTNVPAFLQEDVSQDGWPVVTFDIGSISLWYQANWTSTTDSGTGPTNWATLLSFGNWTSNAAQSAWTIAISPSGTILVMEAQSNGADQVVFSVPIDFDAGDWHALTVTYSLTNCLVFLEGQLVASNAPISYYPTADDCTNYGFFIGSLSTNGVCQAHGQFEWLEFYDDAQTTNEVADQYSQVSSFIQYFGGSLPGSGRGFGPDFDGPPAIGGGGSDLSTNGSYTNVYIPAPDFVLNGPLAYITYTNFFFTLSNNSTNCFVTIVSTLSNITYEVLTNDDLSNSNGWGIWQTLLATNNVTPAPPLVLGSNEMFFKGVLNFTLGSNKLLFGPAITITSPTNNLTTAASRIDVLGTVASLLPIQSITVNGTTAYLTNSNFSVLNVPLVAGSNQLLAVAQDISNNTGQAFVNVYGGTNDPLDLVPSVTQGYAPLAVNFTLNGTNLPGTVESVAWDWQGDGITDLTVSNLAGHSNTYSTGTYFPTVTVTTSQGVFSTIGGFNANMEDNRVTIVADANPSIVWSQSANGPVAVKANADGSVYILASSPPAITLYASNQTVLRSLSLTTLGLSDPAATGFDVDANSNVYLAMPTMQLVYKLSPSGTNSYTPDSSFNANESGWLVSPADVAVRQADTNVFVSDPGQTNQIVQFNPDGTEATSIGGFDYPEGLSFDPAGRLIVANTGPNQVLFVVNGSILDGFDQPAIKASGDSMTLYVTDGTNVEAFESYGYTFIRSVPSSVGLNNPRSVSIWPSMVEERVYIADYGNNRVIAVTFPQQSDPVAVWNSMVQAVTNNNLNEAISCFSMFTAGKYSAEYQAFGLTNVSSVLSQLPTPTLLEATENYAHYYVTITTNGIPLAFYINFANENGIWKISSF